MSDKHSWWTFWYTLAEVNASIEKWKKLEEPKNKPKKHCDQVIWVTLLEVEKALEKKKKI